MSYTVKEIQRGDILSLLTAALAEYDAVDRCKKLNWTAKHYFEHADDRAHWLGYEVFYLAVCGAEEFGDPIGFARFTLEDTIPGYQSLPGDKSAIGLDEVYITPAFRGRGVFPVLIHGVRELALSLGAAYIYARVVNRKLAHAFQRYGLGAMPLLVGTLNQLRLPKPDQLASETDWSFGVQRQRWKTGEHELAGLQGRALNEKRERFGEKGGIVKYGK